MIDVITIGGITYDIFIKTSPLKTVKKDKGDMLCFDLGSKILASDVQFSPGGGAGNTSVGLDKLRLNVLPLGMVGKDDIADTVLNEFKKGKIDTSLIKKKSGLKTGLSVILSSSDGERTVFMYRGANDKLKIKIEKLKIKNTKWLFVSHLSGGSHECIKDLIEFTKENPKIKIAWNLGETQLVNGKWHIAGSMVRKFCKLADLLIVNKEEAERIAQNSNLKVQNSDIESLGNSLKSLGSRIVVITDGRNGACVWSGRDHFKMPAYPAKKVSTLGAGNAFSSGFLASMILNNEDVALSLKWGVINGAGVIEKYGAQNGLLTRREVERRLKGWKQT